MTSRAITWTRLRELSAASLPKSVGAGARLAPDDRRIVELAFEFRLVAQLKFF